eukprot:SAG11_NODE_25237_length_361_cov_1.561069_1_plen_54_part_10
MQMRTVLVLASHACSKLGTARASSLSGAGSNSGGCGCFAEGGCCRNRLASRPSV